MTLRRNFALFLSDQELSEMIGWGARHHLHDRDEIARLVIRRGMRGAATAADEVSPSASADAQAERSSLLDDIADLRVERTKAETWARDEQAKRHAAEHQRTEARSALASLSNDFAAMEDRAGRSEAAARRLHAGLSAAYAFIRSEREVVFESITVSRDESTIDEIDRQCLAEIDDVLRLVEEALVVPGEASSRAMAPRSSADLVGTYVSVRRRFSAPRDGEASPSPRGTAGRGDA